MAGYAALLRAVNVGGTGKLAMSDLKALCVAAGLEDVATYIQSGNVVFRSRRSEASVKKLLEQALEEHMGKPVGVLIRDREELDGVLRANPFPKAAPNRVIVMFLDAAPPKTSFRDVICPDGEEIVLSGRHVFVNYPAGLGRSKLKLPFRDAGTGRNLNTVQKLASLLAGMK
jgi:uncharacterized protein (DUF1697 family)